MEAGARRLACRRRSSRHTSPSAGATPARRASRRRGARGPWARRTGCSLRRRGGPPSARDPPRLAVDVHAAVANEAAERDPAVLGELDREARGRADRDEDRAPGDGGLLDELEG